MTHELAENYYALFVAVELGTTHDAAFTLITGQAPDNLNVGPPLEKYTPPPSVPEGMKRCSKCKEIKPLEAFYPGKGQNYCKDCGRAYAAEKQRIRRAQKKNRKQPGE